MICIAYLRMLILKWLEYLNVIDKVCRFKFDKCELNDHLKMMNEFYISKTNILISSKSKYITSFRSSVLWMENCEIGKPIHESEIVYLW